MSSMCFMCVCTKKWPQLEFIKYRSACFFAHLFFCYTSHTICSRLFGFMFNRHKRFAPTSTEIANSSIILRLVILVRIYFGHIRILSKQIWCIFMCHEQQQKTPYTQTFTNRTPNRTMFAVLLYNNGKLNRKVREGYNLYHISEKNRHDMGDRASSRFNHRNSVDIILAPRWHIKYNFPQARTMLAKMRATHSLTHTHIRTYRHTQRRVTLDLGKIVWKLEFQGEYVDIVDDTHIKTLTNARARTTSINDHKLYWRFGSFPLNSNLQFSTALLSHSITIFS